MKNLFPILENHPDLVYLDSAATALAPASVIEAEAQYASFFGTNATRGLYPLAEATSTVVNDARAAVAAFIKASPESIIFSSGTTGAINMLANALGGTLTNTAGNIIVSIDAHHSQILPWDNLALQKSWELITTPVNNDGTINTEKLLAAITPDTRVIALTLVSNVYGVIQDLAPLILKIRVKNSQAFIVVDAAQAVAHVAIDVESLGADALIFSGHKLYGPTGIGVCYLEKNWLTKLNPGQFGGGMVEDTSATPTRWKAGPEKFEAGTLPLAQIFGLKAAIEFITGIGLETIRSHEQGLIVYCAEKLRATFGDDLSFLGTTDPKQKIGLLSFTLKNTHPHDLATLLGEQNICVRAGEHCASFLHRDLKIPATTRVSFGIYTTKSDIDLLVATLVSAHALLQR